MASPTPDLPAIAEGLDTILERFDKLEVQVHGLVTSQTVEAREFVVKDKRGGIRVRLGVQAYAPCLLIALRAGGSPSIQVGAQTMREPERALREV